MTTARNRSGRWRAHVDVGQSAAVLRILYRNAAGTAALLGVLVVVQVACELGVVVVLSFAFNDVLNAANQDRTLPDALPRLVAITGLYLVRQATGPIVVALAAALDRRVRGAAGSDLIRVALATPLEKLETEATADELERARGVSLEASFKPRVVTLFVDATMHRLRLGAVALILLWFNWWAPLLFLGGAVVAYGWARREVLAYLHGHNLGTEAFRRAGYFFDLALDRGTAKEVRLFGLGPWLRQRFEHWQRDGLRQVQAQRTGAFGLVVSGLFASLAIGAVFASVLVFALENDVDRASALLFLTATLTGAGAILVGESWVWQLAAAPFERLLTLERTLAPSGCPRSTTIDVSTGPVALQVSSLSFEYPSGASVLRGVDLTIEAGQSVAIVGRNGAGKTTLVKLICRLYEPAPGTIKVDGREVTDLNRAAWRRRLAVIFQDYVRYPLSAADNVSLGRIPSSDVPSLQAAARRAQAAELVDKLPNGWETYLASSHPEGVEVSGGEWQRLSLARALAAVAAGAGLLILDEPTASLDAEAEAEFNERLIEQVRGVTTIVISHRLPTVRKAQRIFVLDDGQVAEAGSHEDLMAREGLYARMFRIQAARYDMRDRA